MLKYVFWTHCTERSSANAHLVALKLHRRWRSEYCLLFQPHVACMIALIARAQIRICSKLYLLVVDAESQPLWLPLRPDSTPSHLDLTADVGCAGDGSRPSAAQRRLMVTCLSGFWGLDRRFVMIASGTNDGIHSMGLWAPPQGHMHGLRRLYRTGSMCTCFQRI